MKRRDLITAVAIEGNGYLLTCYLGQVPGWNRSRVSERLIEVANQLGQNVHRIGF